MIGLSRFRTVICAGLIIRLLISPFFAHPFDVFTWYTNAENLLSGAQPVWNYMMPYSYSFFLFAFPAGAAFNFLTQYFGSFTLSMSSLSPILNPSVPSDITLVPGVLFDFLVKLPLIASDTLVAVLLYNLMEKYSGDERVALSVCIMWWLNPLTIWVSAGWGMFDTLAALFALMTLYFLMKQEFALTGFSLAIAIAMKYYAAIFVLPVLLLSWRDGRKVGLIHASLALIGSSALLFGIFLVRVFRGFNSIVTTATPEQLHYSGLSIWTAITLFYSTFNQDIVSYGLLGAYLIVFYVLILRYHTEGDLALRVLYFGFPLIGTLLFYRFVGENYFIWLLPFASILAAEDHHSKVLYWALSLLAFLSSIVDSLLPYYMLPMAPWIGGYLVKALTALGPYHAAPGGTVTQGVTLGKAVLAGFGVLMGGLLIATAARWVKVHTLKRSFSQSKTATSTIGQGQ